jgi:hypothetical protein
MRSCSMSSPNLTAQLRTSWPAAIMLGTFPASYILKSTSKGWGWASPPTPSTSLSRAKPRGAEPGQAAKHAGPRRYQTQLDLSLVAPNAVGRYLAVLEAIFAVHIVWLANTRNRRGSPRCPALTQGETARFSPAGAPFDDAQDRLRDAARGRRLLRASGSVVVFKRQFPLTLRRSLLLGPSRRVWFPFIDARRGEGGKRDLNR